MITWFVAVAMLMQDAHLAHRPAAARPDLIDVARRPLPLRSGIGGAHDPVSTKSKPAQAFYDQGLAYLHSYVWLEAARSFNRALALDPALAVAHAMLSVAYTELNLPEPARDAIERAKTLAAKGPEHDRRHVDARALQMAAEEARADPARLTAYRTALDEDLRKFPDDEEFWLMRGLAASSDAGERGQGSGPASITFYERARSIAADHVAAHHYLTHVYENSGRVNDALAEGAVYAKLASNIPHARHMRGHDLRRAGRTEEAIAEFSAADRLEQAYFTAEKIPVEYDWHYQHNLDLLATSYEYVGQMRKAETTFQTSFAISSSLVEQEFNKREWPVFLLARGRAKEALDAARDMTSHRSPVVAAAGHVLAGEARLVLGEFQASADEANAALRLMRGTEGAGLVVNALQALQGEFLLRTGQNEKGHATLTDVVRKLRAAPGPDAWTAALFTLETIARTARQAGDWEFAAWTANQMIEHDPNYAGGYYAQALVAQHQGDPTAARTRFEQAAKLWKNADPDLPELVAIRKTTVTGRGTVLRPSPTVERRAP